MRIFFMLMIQVLRVETPTKIGGMNKPKRDN